MEKVVKRAGRLSILLLCDNHGAHANTLLDHVDAFVRHSRNDVRVFNPRGLGRSRFLDLDEFDVVVVHYSLVVTWDQYLAPFFREQLSRYRGLKVQFIQDEYRSVDQFTELIRELGIDVLFTLASEEQAAQIYGGRLPGVTTVTTLAGYVPQRLVGRSTPPIGSRPIDIGYRGRIVPYWLGRLGQEKIAIAEAVRTQAGRYGLRCDIAVAEEDRIYGKKWDRFIASCKSMLGTESGASIVDWDGSREHRVNAYLVERPGASFEDVHKAILAPDEGNLELPVISPRVFEAIALRTAVVLFPGLYSGLIEPWEHYIPLEKDLSNFDDVAAKLRDPRFMTEITDRAYRDIIGSGRYSYTEFIRRFDEIVESRAETAAKGAGVSYRLARAEALFAPDGPALQRLFGRRLWDSGRFLARGYVLARLVLAARPLRRIAVRYLVHPSLRAASIRDLAADLLRLGVLARAQRHELDTGEPFAVEAHFDAGHGRLRLWSRRPGTESVPGVDLDGLRAAFAERRISEIAWSHVEIGNTFAYRLAGVRALRFPVGRDNPITVHSFGALVALAAEMPDTVFDALVPVLNGAKPPAADGRAVGDRQVRQS